MREIRDVSLAGWRYYNHALLPDCAPHILPDVSLLEDKSTWRGGGYSAPCSVDFRLGLWL